MASHDDELLEAARRLLMRRAAQRGRLPAARIRRSISTSYYALFHFVLDEVGLLVVGAHNDLRKRRRLLARMVSHKGARTTFEKIRGTTVDASIADFVRATGAAGPTSAAPAFAKGLANAFVDAQTKRIDADYDLSKPLSELDARLLRLRVKRAIAAWKKATTLADRDFKHAICLLIILKGQLRFEP